MRYANIRIEVVRNGYVVHAGDEHMRIGHMGDIYVFRSATELGKWITEHAGDFEE